MFRRIALVMLTLAVLVGAFLLIRQYTSSSRRVPRPMVGNLEPVEIDPNQAGGKIVGVNVGPLVRPVWYYADPQTGRRRAIYSAKLATQAGDQFQLTEPSIELLPESGQTIKLTAAKGSIVADVTGGKIVPRFASLMDGVEITVSRVPDQSGEDTGQLLRADLERLDLDLQRQEMEAPGSVRIQGAGLELQSRDLSFSWNMIEAPTPWTLRRLRLAGAGTIRLDPALLKQPRQEQQAAASSSPAATASSAETQPAPVSQSAPETTAYDLKLADSIQVTSARGWLKDANNLEALFTYKLSKSMVKPAAAGGEGNGAASSAAGGAATASAPEAKRLNQVGEDATEIQWAGSLELVPADPNIPAPSTTQPRIVANGSLMGSRMSLGTFKKVFARGQKHAEQSVAPSHVVDVAANCDLFETQGDWGRLASASDRLVEMTTGDGVKVVGRDIKLDDKAGAARIDGPGTINLTQRAAASAPASTPADSSSVQWQRGMVLEYKVQPDANGRVDRQPTLATLEGQAVFHARSGQMSAEHMRIPFAPAGANRRPVPRAQLAAAHRTRGCLGECAHPWRYGRIIHPGPAEQ